MRDTTDLSAWVEARPFSPFVIHLADGRSFEVARPSAVSVSSDGRSLAVWSGHFHILDIGMITGIQRPDLVDPERRSA